MSRKTYRSDDVCFLLRPDDVMAGIETVGALGLMPSIWRVQL